VTGWWQYTVAGIEACGPRLSAVILLLLVTYHYSDPRRRIRRGVAYALLRLLGAPEPLRLTVKRPACQVWLRPFSSGDVQSFVEIFMRRCYPAPGGGTVLDAGAHIGLFSVFALEGGSADHVIAVEPDVENIGLLRRNLAGYCDAVSIVEAALWPREGFHTFVRGTESNLGHMANVEPEDGSVAVTCAVRTVSPDSDELPPPEMIDYLKLDVEGAEDLVLEEYIYRVHAGSQIVAELHGPKIVERFRPLLQDAWRVIEEDESRLVFQWVARASPGRTSTNGGV
jgi:FkbM family methyltransferase